MGFFIVYLLIGFFCGTWSGYSLTAHGGYPTWLVYCVYAAFWGAWFSPIIIWRWQHKNSLPLRVFNAAAYLSHLLFGVAFFLFALLIVRDFLWYDAYIFGLPVPSPFAVSAARISGLITLAIAALCCGYAVYVAARPPRVLRYTYRHPRIKRVLRVLVISDWHINRTIAAHKVAERVALFNALKPDVILMPGDIADDTPQMMKPQLQALKKLSAPLGIYYTLGNHEIYNNAWVWESEFAALGWRVLHNSGVAVEDSGVYISGVPDSASFAVNITQAVKNAAADDYRILLSHQPATALQVQKGQVDLVVAGHTHGGQIFPFNFFTKFGNAGFVAGEYRLNNTTLLLSRGAGYWGPPMRLGAPADVLLINLETH